jgi:hypothetical protein
MDITNNRLLLLSIITFEALVTCFGLLFYASRL